MVETPELDQLAADRVTAELTRALPELEMLVWREQKAILDRVESLVASSELSGERAIALWMEFRAATKLLDRVRGKVRVLSAGLNRKVPGAMLNMRPTAGPEAV